MFSFRPRPHPRLHPHHNAHARPSFAYTCMSADSWSHLIFFFFFFFYQSRFWLDDRSWKPRLHYIIDANIFVAFGVPYILSSLGDFCVLYSLLCSLIALFLRSAFAAASTWLLHFVFCFHHPCSVTSALCSSSCCCSISTFYVQQLVYLSASKHATTSNSVFFVLYSVLWVS